MPARGVHQAGPLQVLVHRASSQPLATAAGDLEIKRIARERWIRDTGLYIGPAKATVLMYVYSGACRLEHGASGEERSEVAGAARIIAVPLGARYRFWVEPSNDLELTIVHADGAICDAWWKGVGGRPQVLAVRRRREIERVLEDIVEHAHSFNQHDRAAALSYFQAFLCVVAGDQTLNLPARSRGDARADECRDLIDEQFQKYTSLGELAAALDMNPDYLTRIYLARFNLSPADHLRRRKMEQACVWLREGNRNIESIARTLGFSDAFAFSKSFKAYSGLAPKLWRQQFKS